MVQSEFLRLLPDFQTVAELFPGSKMCCIHPDRLCHGLYIYTGQEELREDRLYLIRRGDGFPTDSFPWISPDSLEGAADHILCPDFTREQILGAVLALYAELQEQEHMLDGLLFRSAGLDELCSLAAQMLGNPVFIHDDWFIMIGKSPSADQYMATEYVMASEKGFLPRIIVDDFRDDSDYLETYAARSAQIWSSGSGPDCLYVNLWDGGVYRGRLLALRTGTPFRHRDFRLAEVLAQAAMQLLLRKQPGAPSGRSMDDIMYALLQGQQPDAAEQSMLLSMLNWNKQDSLLCIRLQSQQTDITAVSERTLHSDLFNSFSGSYIMITGNQQCLVLNVSRSPQLRAGARHILAPICRDYCLYAGISSPVTGIRDLSLAYIQAEAALNQAFRLRSEKWILSFPECALDYMLHNMASPLQLWNLVSPELLALRDFDRENGTAYFETLRTYLLLERDIPRTSEALIIHRTTLLYRLKKIHSLVHLDLDDPQQRLYLMISLKILDEEP